MTSASFRHVIKAFTREGNEYRPIIEDDYGQEQKVVWAPLPGSQELFLQAPEFEVLLEGTRGGGKCCTLQSLVHTDSGWKQAGQVNLSDRLVAPDGTYTKIVGIHPNKNVRMNRVVFDDGGEVTVCDDHLWEVWDGTNGNRDGWVVKNTAWLASRIEKRCGWHIPLMSAPAPGPEWDGYDPYIIGVVIGDGTMKSARGPVVYTPEPEIQRYLKVAGWTEYNYPGYRRGGVKQMTLNPGGGIGAPIAKGDQKYIPPKLLMADPASRLAVLQGLLDTDGHCDKEGRCEFTSASEQLAKDVQYLVRSLGGKARVHRQFKPLGEGAFGHRDYYFRVKITHAGKFVPFRLPRHVARLKADQHGDKRRIMSITPVGVADGVCFEVAHPSHLFVVQDFIVTHNTLTLLMDFCQDVGIGWGAEWRGMLIRQTYPQLADVINMSKRWIRSLWPEAFYNEIKSFWQWPTGELLYFRPIENEAAYWQHHGTNYAWLGWEELTTWPNGDAYRKMFSVVRSPVQGIPLKVRATTNPYGTGHNWVQSRFQLYNWPQKDKILGPLIANTLDEKGVPEPSRRAIHSTLTENRVLMYVDPKYVERIQAAARNKAELDAWLHGSWDIAAGGMFDDIWYSHKDTIVVPDFEVPSSWPITRAYDHGSSKPWSCGYYAESDGTDLVLPDGKVRATVRGDLFRVGECYGWQGQPDVGSRMLVVEIKRTLVQYEVKRGWRDPMTGRCRVRRGPADTQIFDDVNGVCIANDFETPIVIDGMRYRGIVWEKADKGPGSREQGWEQIRKRLKATKRPEHGYREVPGLFVCACCVHWLRTVPTLPRDEKKIDDVDDSAEDHCFVAGTSVDLDCGSVPIEKVPASGYVHSLDRLEPYCNPRLTRRKSEVVRVTFIDGREVVCTPDERFLVDFDEWCYARDLQGREVLCSRSLSAARFKSLTASDIISAVRTFRGKASACISEYGSIIRGLCRQGTTSIINTAAHGMGFAIWNAFPVRTTYASMGLNLVNVGESILHKLVSRRQHGMAPEKVGSGTQSIMRNISEPWRRSESSFNVRNVAVDSLSHTRCERTRSFAAEDARRVTCANVEKLPDLHDVYCLSVPTNRTFSIEGGILVRNCGDETRYRLRYESRAIRSGRTT